MIKQALSPAIFLDRDGVIVENRANYIRSWADVDIFSQALSALARLKHSPYKIVIVTNQSAVGRGIISRIEAESINTQLVKTIEEAGGRIDGVFMCPHAPEEGCNCRKPQPGLLLEAARELRLEVGKSIMIGDALTDLLAGKRAGVPLNVLVRTGRGTVQNTMPVPKELGGFPIFDTLSAAVSALLDLRA